MPDTPYIGNTAIIITGPVGAGKSTVAMTLHELVGRHGHGSVLFDMDYLRQVYPQPVNDAYAANLGYRVLADAWKHVTASDFGDAGPIAIAILADVVESPQQIEHYQRALPGLRMLVVRLRVPIPLIHARLRQREAAHQLPWYLDRAVELEQIMTDAGVGDMVIDIADDTPDMIALRIAAQVGLSIPNSV